jgi:rRNA maturation endonuclease Nob1
MTTFIRCRGADCGAFFEKRLGECPSCGHPLNEHSGYWARRVRRAATGASAASNLNRHAEHAVKYT